VRYYGEAGHWDLFPAVWSGTTGPLAWCPPAEIETPEIQRVGVGPRVTIRQYGIPVGEIGEGWGLGQDSRDLDSRDLHESPADSAERVCWVDRQRCIDCDPAEIVPEGVAWELVTVEVPSSSVGVLEILHTILSVEALDEDGVPVYTYAGLGGERPCLEELEHPDDDVDPLSWRWSLQVQHTPTHGGPGGAGAYQGPVLPQHVLGTPRIPAWDDLRYGHARPAQDLDLVIGARERVSVWVELYGPPDRYRVRAGARLAGYTQSAGRRGAALASSTRRFDR